MEINENIGMVVKNLSNEIHRCLISQKPDRELTYTQCRIISFVHQRSPQDVFQKNIEQAFNIRRSTATGILKLMEKNGLILRLSTKEDARLKKIVLTQKGLEIHENTKAVIKNIEHAMKSGISQKELSSFLKTSEKIYENLKIFQSTNINNRKESDTPC